MFEFEDVGQSTEGRLKMTKVVFEESVKVGLNGEGAL